ncbi:MAG: PilZ domain-containing protein [Myxococcales bacterium]|nr:PilZ domain-containing protein [Myxococcales bacterium]
MSAKGRVLVVGFPRGAAELRSDLLQLGFLPLEVDDLGTASREFARGTPLNGLVFLNAHYPEHGLRPALEQLRTAARGSAQLVAVGATPHLHTRRLLRDSGVPIGLWTPYELEDLRLAIDIATPGIDAERRSYRRVPTAIRAQLSHAERRIAATIRDLSVSGGRFEAAEPVARGTELVAHFALAGEPLALRARVAFAIEPRESDARVSFGVRFLSPPSAALAALAGYVNARTDARRV